MQYRTHTCWELTEQNIWQEIRLAGWVHSKRDHWGLIFIDLRDRYWITQIVFDPTHSQANFDIADSVKNEFVINIYGKVAKRPEWLENPNITTGKIEIVWSYIKIISKANVLPFQIDEHADTVAEDIRLKYRYVDLRRESLKENVLFRSKFINFLHNWFQKEGFVEIQTPILTGSSPEWARDFLVPSRLNKWKFYALPQAPQQYKQLIMIWGFDKYYQIAPCFRDEDARADRSPWEFYQLDVETSFMTQDEFHDYMEPLFYQIVKEFAPQKTIPWDKLPKIKWHDAMEEYGSDKPDLRFGMKIQNVSDVFKNTEFTVFKHVLEDPKWAIKTIKLEWKNLSRKELDDLNAFAIEKWAKWLAYIIWEDAWPRSPIIKFFSEQEIQELKDKTWSKVWDILFFSAWDSRKGSEILGAVRLKLRDIFQLADKNVMAFAWIVDFPFFEWDEDNDKWEFSHNPFSMPQCSIEDFDKVDPASIVAYQYDIICNGYELSSWAVRNYDPEILIKAFGMCGYDEEVVKKSFPALYEAFQYGAPPHCGFAPWIDRIIMLLRDEPNIRQVIAFPKNGKAQDLLMNAPGDVDPKLLRDLGIDIKQAKPDSK